MNKALPYLAALQWLGGVLLAEATVRSTRRFGSAGRTPRGLARLALALFILATIALVVTLPFFAHTVASWLPPEASTPEWRLQALLAISQVAWIVLLVAMGWNGLLALVTRRRAARAELARRRERVTGGHDTQPR